MCCPFLVLLVLMITCGYPRLGQLYLAAAGSFVGCLFISSWQYAQGAITPCLCCCSPAAINTMHTVSATTYPDQRERRCGSSS